MFQRQNAIQPRPRSDGWGGRLPPSLSRNYSTVASAKEPPRREDRNPAEPEIRSPKLEIRNKSELPGIGHGQAGSQGDVSSPAASNLDYCRAEK